MLLTKEVTVNLGYRNVPVVDAVQGDSGRRLVLHFVDGEDPWQIPQNARFILQYCCSDGIGGVYDTLPDGSAACLAEGDTLTVQLLPQLCAVAGNTRLQVSILCDGQQVTTFPVVLQVAEGVMGTQSERAFINLEQWLTEAICREDFIDAVVHALPDGDEVMY